MIRMILADDEPIITRGIKKLLNWKILGIEIIGEYEDGRKALEAIIRDKPEIALLDISMPGMSGVEVLQECRAMESGVSHSTLKNIMHETVKDNLLSTTILLASGFDMTVSQFLDSPLFNEENLNI